MSDDAINKEELPALLADLESGLREIGIYVDRSQWVFPDEDAAMGVDATEVGDVPKDMKGAVLMVECLIGDLFFSKRVQDPEQLDFDKQFRSMAREMKKAEAEALREEILRKVNGD